VPQDPATPRQALSVAAFPAEPAPAARTDARHQHPVALADPANAGTGLLHRPDRLMAEDPALGDLGNVALEDVQVRTADRDGIHPHDHVAIVGDFRVGNRLPRPLPWPVLSLAPSGCPKVGRSRVLKECRWSLEGNAKSRDPEVMRSLFNHSVEDIPVLNATAPGASLLTADRACCCNAHPVMTVLVPRDGSRSHFTDLLLCRHHFHASEDALGPIGATVYDEDGQLVL
jgi:hypothetical protein